MPDVCAATLSVPTWAVAVALGTLAVQMLVTAWAQLAALSICREHAELRTEVERLVARLETDSDGGSESPSEWMEEGAASERGGRAQPATPTVVINVNRGGAALASADQLGRAGSRIISPSVLLVRGGGDADPVRPPRGTPAGRCPAGREGLGDVPE